MKIKSLVTAMILAGLLCSLVHGDSESFKQFRNDYSALDQDVLNNTAEAMTVKNFVYQKDIATITFTDGVIYLLRYINDRPTTAVFIGKGSAQINVPSHVERQALWYAAGDSVVNESFDVCVIRMADDLDLKLKAAFPVEKRAFAWREYNTAKKSQGDIHFQPKIQHEYDNYFELMRTAYYRTEDGYFWMDFNRYEFSYDPNRPEQAQVAYEHQGGDLVNTVGAWIQRKDRGIYEDGKMSDIAYPTTMVSREGTFDLSGIDGRTLRGSADLKIAVNADSMKYLSLFLHYNLPLDSIFVNGRQADFKRRGDFNFIGVILPDMHHRGDTLNVKMWYGGRNYYSIVPSVENPAATPIRLTFTASGDFEYAFPGMRDQKKLDGKQTFVVEPDQPFDEFFVETYSKGFQKVADTAGSGLPITFLKDPSITKNKFECFVPEKIYDSVIKGAINFMGARLGNPPGAFDYLVRPTEGPQGVISMPGILEISQVRCILAGTGGFELVASQQAAKQWFGSLMRPASSREGWLAAALPEYLSLLYVDQAVPGGAFYSEMVQRRNLIDSVVARGNDRPLGIAASRLTDSLIAYKGAWVLHMLRSLMLDPATQSERQFQRFLTELVYTVNNKMFTNADIQRIAEKYYGQPLDWFFNYWVYGRNYPSYQVTYIVAPKDNQFVIDVSVAVKGVDGNFKMPVMISIVGEDGTTSFVRQMINGMADKFRLGPFASNPKDFRFNEFFSVLCQSKVDKGK